MLLRESGKLENREIDLGAVMDTNASSGVANATLLMSFANAAVFGDTRGLEQARSDIATNLGERAVVEVASIAALFSMLDRLANGIGIPLEDFGVDATSEFRERLGINGFRSAANTPAAA